MEKGQKPKAREKDEFDLEDPKVRGIITDVNEGGRKKEDEEEYDDPKKVPVDKFVKYNRSYSEDPVERVRANAKRYGVSFYMGKRGNDDVFMANPSGKGVERYGFNVTDSAVDELNRSSINDFGAQIGLSNAVRQLGEKGIELITDVMSVKANKTGMGGDTVLLRVKPKSGVLSDEERKTVQEVMKQNGVMDNNAIEVGIGEVNQDSEGKQIFAKQSFNSPEEAVDAIAGIKDGKELKLPKGGKNDGDYKYEKKQYKSLSEMKSEDVSSKPLEIENNYEKDKSDKLRKIRAEGTSNYKFTKIDGRMIVKDKDGKEILNEPAGPESEKLINSLLVNQQKKKRSEEARKGKVEKKDDDQKAQAKEKEKTEKNEVATKNETKDETVKKGADEGNEGIDSENKDEKKKRKRNRRKK